MAYILHLLILITIFSILSVSLNLIMGYTGLLNLGHIAFYGIGGYTSALITLPNPVGLGLPWWLGFILAGFVSLIFGLLIGVPVMKLKGDYLAIATLGFMFIAFAFTKNLSITRGPMGLPGISNPFFLIIFDSQVKIFILYSLISIISIYIMYRVVNGPFGRVLVCIREDEIAAKALGKNTFKFKLQALMISAFFAGIAGSMYVHYIRFIDPSTIDFLGSILLLCMVVLGGVGSFKGSIIGAVLITLIPEPIKFLNLPADYEAALRMIIFSIILLCFMLIRPRGLFGEKRFKVTEAGNAAS
jgi:branched-chain amino acid transport system permease protein